MSKESAFTSMVTLQDRLRPIRPPQLKTCSWKEGATNAFARLLEEQAILAENRAASAGQLWDL